MISIGADEDLFPSSVTSGGGVSWTEAVEEDGSASVELVVLWGVWSIIDRQFGRMVRGLYRDKSELLDDSSNPPEQD